ncbi:MAG: hypothetical protein JNK15_13140, partial [Planctomycetes bacterium]|nr:hypothetical protein [Planctomycetota bacterium]
MNAVAAWAAPCLLATSALAQEWNALLQERIAKAEPLVTLAYRRDAHGLFEVGPAEGGAVPIELVRRFGDVRVDHAVATLRTLGLGTTMKFDWTLDAVGRFEPDVLAGAMRELVANDTTTKSTCGVRDGVVQVRAPLGELDATATRITARGKRTPGRMPTEFTASVLAAGPGLRIVLPATSKLLLGAVAALEVPGVGRTDVEATFVDGLHVRVTIAVQDEDAAATIVGKLTQRARDAVEPARRKLAGRAPEAAIGELVAVLTAVRCEAREGAVVVTTS